jgi:hypothetical protein
MDTFYTSSALRAPSKTSSALRAPSKTSSALRAPSPQGEGNRTFCFLEGNRTFCFLEGNRTFCLFERGDYTLKIFLTRQNFSLLLNSFPSKMRDKLCDRFVICFAHVIAAQSSLTPNQHIFKFLFTHHSYLIPHHSYLPTHHPYVISGFSFCL